MKKSKSGARQTEQIRIYSDTAQIMREYKREFRIPLIHLYEKAIKEWSEAGPEFDVPYGALGADNE